nr:hypothetical protein [Tanacetum cinerariifolium]
MLFLLQSHELSCHPNLITAVETDHDAFNSIEHVKSPRHTVQPIETSIPAATPAPASPKSNSSGKRRNRKTYFVCKSVDHLIKDCDYHAKKMAQSTQRTYAHRGNHKQYTLLTHKKPQQHMVPTAVLTQSKPVFNTSVRPVSAVVPRLNVTRPRLTHPTVTQSKSPIRRHITRSPSLKTSNLPLRVIAAQALVVSAAQGNPKGGKISGKGKIKTVKGNLVRGLPKKVFENDNTCVACKKGKKHRASCKTKPVSSVDQPIFRLYMDLFGPTFVKSLNKKSYCLVITDDYTRFTWVFFLTTKDETSPILKTFITGLENQLSLKEFRVPRTPQQNGIAERKNRTLIEAARTMLTDLLLPIPFWAEAVNTACYVQNRVLVTKPHNKTPYELLHGYTP